MSDTSTEAVQVIKIGGSIITSKDGDCDFNHAQTNIVGNSLASFKGSLVIVHGTGSFGKPPARNFGYLDGFLSIDRKDVVVRVENLLRTLRLKVLETFIQCGLPVFGVHVRELFHSDGSQVYLSTTKPITDLLERGLIPVISGGFVIDRSGGFRVYSSDRIATELAKTLQASRLIFATDQPGVYSTTAEPVLLDQFYADDLCHIAENYDDVSNGMKGKLDAAIAAANAGLHTVITDGRSPENILNFLKGKPARGTRIIGNSPIR